MKSKRRSGNPASVGDRVERHGPRAAGNDERPVIAATTVLNEIMRGDKAIPEDGKPKRLRSFRREEGRFVVGGQWGRGLISVRDARRAMVPQPS
jgi:hypothetical protein